MSTTIRLKGGTAAAWTAANPVLESREPGVETDTLKLKVGDGVTAWNDLGYWAGGGAGSDATTVVKGIVRLGGDLAGTADSPTVVSGTNHTHTAAQVSDASTVGRSVLTAATATLGRDALAAAEKAKTEGMVFHDGTTGGGTRPSGHFRVRWVQPLGTTYARPTNMLTGDTWEYTP